MEQAVQADDSPGTTIDAGLIEAAAGGDTAARERLARACLPRVRRKVYLMYGSHPDVEDVIQDAMCKAFRRLDQLDSHKPGIFYRCLDTIACGTVIDKLRAGERFKGLLSQWAHFEDSRVAAASTPDREVMRASAGERLQDILQKIKPKKRVAVVLSLVGGYTAPEVAAIMGCSVEAAKKRVKHGREELIERAKADEDYRGLLQEVVK
jgi:RNA polymerase sigma-70 factor (ECF subfamily)